MERNKLPKFRFNIYYEEGQEGVVEADTVEEARERIMEGNYDTAGNSWDVGVRYELIPNEPDED